MVPTSLDISAVNTADPDAATCQMLNHILIDLQERVAA